MNKFITIQEEFIGNADHSFRSLAERRRRNLAEVARIQTKLLCLNPGGSGKQTRRDSLLTHFEEGEPLALVEDQVFVDEGRFCGHAVVTAQLVILRVLQAQAENTASLRRTSERPQKHR